MRHAAAGSSSSEPDDITDGACATLGSDGGPIGAYAVTSCVGHECG